MKNVLKQRTYECKCGALTKEYLWDNDLDKINIKCSDCSKLLTKNNLVTQTTPDVVSIRTPTKNR